jgi:alpha-methylacyl-CoA racemase
VIDGAQSEGVAVMMTLYYALFGGGRWADRRGANLTDGSAPFYRCYACRDGRHVAVGALEPLEFSALCQGLKIKPNRFSQYDRRCWDEMAASFADAFATRARDDWADHFIERGACVTPVLSLAEAPHHPHNRARGTFGNPLGPLQPMPAPRFSGTPLEAVPQEEATLHEVLARWT